MNAARAKKAKKPAKMGRPPIANPATSRIAFRVTPEQHARYHAAAAASNLSLSAWIERLLEREAGH